MSIVDAINDARGAWDSSGFYAVVICAASATFAVAAPTLLFAGRGDGAIGGCLAIACWVVLHATGAGVAFWKARGRSRLALHCALVALGLWSAGLVGLQFLPYDPGQGVFYIVASHVETVLDFPTLAGKHNYISLFDGPIIDESGWGMFVVVTVVAAILDLVLLLVVVPLCFTVWLAIAPVNRPGRCDSCGYDIRASIEFGRCPECGTTIANSLERREIGGGAA